MIPLIHELVEASAERNPDGESVRLGDVGQTWASLATSTSRVARVLRDIGLQSGDRVGVLLGKELEVPGAVYGIMQAGGVYVPLDPSAPAARQEAILRDAGARHLVTSSRHARAVRAIDVPFDSVLGLDPSAATDRIGSAISWKDVAAAPKLTAPPKIHVDDLAYLIYTSGTTGTPKGIMHSHRSGSTYARWAANEYGMTPEDRLSNHAPLHFDMSTFDWFAAAAAAATTVMVPTAHLRMPASHSQLLADQRVTVVFTVPFALSQLLERGVLSDRDLSALRWIVFGGESSVTRHVRLLMEALPHTRFSHMYGPAETNGCTHHVLDEPPVADEAIPIGTAFQHMETRVVDESGELTGPGGSGELLVGGTTTMLGYWGRPDMDTSAFVYVRHDGIEKRFYRTGDLVAVREGGDLVFLGRRDRQIKVRGYRVELEEVEAALTYHPAVHEVAAFPTALADGGHTIAAAVQLRPGKDVDASSLLAVASEHLAPYAVPAEIQFVDQLPRTAGGKLDHARLAASSVAPKERSGHVEQHS